MVEEYKLQRLNRTANIMDEIDAVKPEIVERMYQYKLKAELNFEEETYAMQNKLQEMLKDTRRPVAKIEKQKLQRKNLQKLILKQRRKKQS